MERHTQVRAITAIGYNEDGLAHIINPHRVGWLPDDIAKTMVESGGAEYAGIRGAAEALRNAGVVSVSAKNLSARDKELIKASGLKVRGARNGLDENAG